MTGAEYEQFVRAVLCTRLSLRPDELVSTHAPGASLPAAESLKHQIDLYFVEESDVAKYITIVECKYRGTSLVDQPELQNLAFVKDNIRAHKAIMVTNSGFTKGARSLAQNQEIALLVIDPQIDVTTEGTDDDVDVVFHAIEAEIRSNSNAYDLKIVQKLHGDPSDGPRDLIEGLLKDPEVRRKAEEFLRDPSVRETARQLARDNPDLARQAMDFLRKKPW